MDTAIHLEPGVLIDGSHERTDQFDARVCQFVDAQLDTDYWGQLGPIPMEQWSEVADHAITTLDARLPDNLMLMLDEQCLYVVATSDEK